MTFSVIQKSQLEGAMRLDAEYYQPEFLVIDQILYNKSKYLSDLANNVICGPFGSAILNSDYKKEGIPLIRVANLNNIFVQNEDLKFIDQKLSDSLKKYQVVDGDVVVSQRGTVGLFSRVTNFHNIWNISANLISIKQSSKINFDYLLAFLNSKYGISQLMRRLSGQVQPKITTDDIKQIKVFIPSEEIQKNIGMLVSESKSNLDNSKLFYQQAESVLLKELGLENFEAQKKLFSIVNLSDCQKANRIDAEYFSTKYLIIKKALSNTQSLTLIKNFEVLRGGNFQYKNDGSIGVLKTKQLGKSYLDFDVEDKADESADQGGKMPKMMNRDVLFASMGVGSLGKTNIFYDFENNGNFTIDSTLKIFRATNNSQILPEVLQVFLSSKIGQELIYQNVVGSSGIISIYEDYIKNLLIPILPKKTQEKIADLVRKSHIARQKSKELLDQAKRKVEEMVNPPSRKTTEDLKGGDYNSKQ